MAGCVHNERFECNDCTEAAHAEAHPEPVEGCNFCRLSSIQVSQRVKPRRQSGPPTGNRNHWERGIATDHRGVPYLDGAGEVIGVKKFAQDRSQYEGEIRRLRNDPAPFPS